MQRSTLEATFAGRRVLVTGHTGFKGAWLSAWLHRLGANVAGLALEPDVAQRPLFEMVDRRGVFQQSALGSITELSNCIDVFESFQPEIVLHLAAQPLVRYSYERPSETFDVNVMGTVNVLEAARRARTPAVLCVTTDKCYENVEQIWPYREDDRLGGHDPYSASKGAAEVVISSYRRSFFPPDGPTQCASARGGNVVGGGDLSADRLIPDLFRAMISGDDLTLRNPQATRPWQHVLESLSGYLCLAVNLWNHGAEYAEAWNFGPDPSERVSVGEFVQAMNDRLAAGAPRTVMHSGGPHEAGRLALDITKAADRLGWTPILSIDERVELTVEWFAAAASGPVPDSLIDRHLDLFESRWLVAQ